MTAMVQKSPENEAIAEEMHINFMNPWAALLQLTKENQELLRKIEENTRKV